MFLPYESVLCMDLEENKNVPLTCFYQTASHTEYNVGGLLKKTATIGRYLKILDSKGYTEQKGNLVRILSAYGVSWLSEMEDNLTREEVRKESSEALKVNKYSDLTDLMRARKAIEVETVRLALYATTEEITALRRSINVYYRYIAEKRTL